MPAIDKIDEAALERLTLGVDSPQPRALARLFLQWQVGHSDWTPDEIAQLSDKVEGRLPANQDRSWHQADGS